MIDDTTSDNTSLITNLDSRNTSSRHQKPSHCAPWFHPSACAVPPDRLEAQSSKDDRRACHQDTDGGFNLSAAECPVLCLETGANSKQVCIEGHEADQDSIVGCSCRLDSRSESKEHRFVAS